VGTCDLPLLKSHPAPANPCAVATAIEEPLMQI